MVDLEPTFTVRDILEHLHTNISLTNWTKWSTLLMMPYKIKVNHMANI